MLIGVVAETDPRETRVAASAETVKKFIGLGAEVAVQEGAGLSAGITNADYQAAGARIVAAPEAFGADILLKVRRPNEAEIAQIKSGALVIAAMDPYGHQAEIEAMANAGVSAFAMELMPRITRAQVMDILSSQANLAGYRAVIDATSEYGRALPMMMTPAGTVPAAKIFIMGVGVAGLQAIATARRLGAIVTATDVRPATKEQVESLGAKFVAVEDDEFKHAETAGGYAKEMSDAYKAKHAYRQAGHRHHHRADPRSPGAAPHQRGNGQVDADGVRDRGHGGRARRQLRVIQDRRVGHDRKRRTNCRLFQCDAARGDRFGALCAQPLRFRRDPHRQIRQDDRSQLGRRTCQGDVPDARRRRRTPEFPAQGGVTPFNP
jgi:hypothetical protein